MTLGQLRPNHKCYTTTRQFHIHCRSRTRQDFECVAWHCTASLFRIEFHNLFSSTKWHLFFQRQPFSFIWKILFSFFLLFKTTHSFPFHQNETIPYSFGNCPPLPLEEWHIPFFLEKHASSSVKTTPSLLFEKPAPPLGREDTSSSFDTTHHQRHKKSRLRQSAHQLPTAIRTKPRPSRTKEDAQHHSCRTKICRPIVAASVQYPQHCFRSRIPHSNPSTLQP